jgi:hypothetical protein
MVVEKVARTRKITNLNQLLSSLAGHFRDNPKNLLLYPLVLPFFGFRNEPRWIKSPKKGKGQMVHQILPPRGVKNAMRRKSQTAHIKRTPRFLPDILVPKIEVIMTI